MRKPLKWIGITLGGLVAVALCAGAVLAMIGRSRLNAKYEVSEKVSDEVVRNASIEDRRRIASSRGCTECHDQGLQGKVFADIPPGLIVAPNLTRGQGGVGAQYPTANEWNRAIRYGVRPNGSLIFPFMPYDILNRLSEADIASLAAYIASLPPVDNTLPATKVRPLGYLIMGTPGMNPSTKLAEFGKPRTNPPPGVTAEYGKYIASTNCVVCHGETLQGGKHPNPDGAPGPELSHVGMWPVDSFVTAMRTGVVPGGRKMSEWMPWQFLGVMNDDELRVIHEYLKTVPPPTPGKS